MFNFLASQHRVLPEGATCDEEEDEVQLRSTRYAEQLESWAWSERALKRVLFLGTNLYGIALPYQTCHQPGASHGHALSPSQKDVQRGCGCLQVSGVAGGRVGGGVSLGWTDMCHDRELPGVMSPCP